MEIDQRYLITLLQTPVESDKTDYKSAIVFNEGEDFSLKLVKHILGFTNSGGGHIVIGFREDPIDGLQKIDQALTDDVVRSYEVTRLSSYVNSILGNQDRIGLTISKVEFSGKRFPIIYVASFKKRPYFCKRDFKLLNGNVVLEDGAIYIRVPGAQTVKVAGTGDWDRLISQCVEAEHETFVRRAKDVLSKEPPQKVILSTEKLALRKLEEARKRFQEKLKE